MGKTLYLFERVVLRMTVTYQAPRVNPKRRSA